MAPIASAVITSRPYMLRPRLVGVWEEQLLSSDLILCDRLLTLRRDEPVDEGLAEFFLDVLMLGRIHQHHAILIKQPLVATDQDVQVAAVLERQPGAAIGEHVGVRRRRRVQRSAHALTDRAYQGPLLLSISMAAAFQRSSSAMCVPDRSPREIKAVALALIALNPWVTSFMPLMPAGSLFGPINTKSLYMTG